MGTYILRPNGVQSKTSEWRGFNATANPGICSAVDADLVETAFSTAFGTRFLTQDRFCNPGASVIGNNLIRFVSTQSDPVWFLDGSGIPVTFLSLAAGFTIDSATVRLDKTSGTTAGAYHSNAANELYLQFSALQESSDFVNSHVAGAAIASFAHPSLPVTALDLLLNGMGIRYNATLGAGDVMSSQGFEIFGIYSITSFTWQWDINPISGTNLDPGETVTITSDPNDPTALCLDHLTIELTGCGVITPIVQECNLYVFTIPEGCSGIPDVVATGDGTQFDGTITLGTFTILTADASGIYVFTDGKLTDTLYSGARDGTTFDVKIPDPFGKTGFIGG